jgi:hypothetical protein
LVGKIIFFSLFKGHNNDQSTYNQSKINDMLIKNKCYILSDRGFFGSNVIRPDDSEIKKYNLRGFRAVIENVFGNASILRFNILKSKIETNPYMSSLIIRACY